MFGGRKQGGRRQAAGVLGGLNKVQARKRRQWQQRGKARVPATALSAPFPIRPKLVCHPFSRRLPARIHHLHPQSPAIAFNRLRLNQFTLDTA